MNKSEDSNRERKKVQTGNSKFGIPMANDALVNFPLGSLILSRMKEMQEERMINYGL